MRRTQLALLLALIVAGLAWKGLAHPLAPAAQTQAGKAPQPATAGGTEIPPLHKDGGVQAPALQPAAGPPLTVSVLDVGQGDSILVQFPNGENMLEDAGIPAEGPVVVNYLKTCGVKRIDILAASHPHEDHLGGMAAVLRAFPVGKVWDSGFAYGSKTQQRYLQTIQSLGLQFGQPKAGYAEDVGVVHVQVLAPVRVLRGTDSDANNNCLVLRLAYGKISFLLAGDMEGDERATVAQWPPTTVLKVAHHGSRNGTDAAFLAALQPTQAAISCGVNNDYGFPHPETLQMLAAANVVTHVTATDGTIVYTTDGDTVSVKTLGK